MNTFNPLRMILAAAVLSVMVGTGAFAQGKIEVVGGDTYDWGAVAPAKLKGVIEVKNVGDDTLNITGVRPSCGCTTAPIDRSVLLPGESGKISVEIDMSTRSGPTSKTITVTSNDPKNPTQIIYLKADVKRAMTFSPAEYFLVNEGKVGMETPASIRIANTGDQAFTVYPPEFTKGNVRVRFDMMEKRELKPGEEMELVAHITPMEAGSAQGIIHLKTSSSAPEYQGKDLPIYGSVAVPPAPPAVKEDAPSMSNNKR